MLSSYPLTCILPQDFLPQVLYPLTSISLMLCHPHFFKPCFCPTHHISRLLSDFLAFLSTLIKQWYKNQSQVSVSIREHAVICLAVPGFSHSVWLFPVLFMFLHILQFYYLWLNQIPPCTHTTISLSIHWLMDIYSLDFLKYFHCHKMIVSFSESLILLSLSYNFYKTYICFSVPPFHFYLDYI